MHKRIQAKGKARQSSQKSQSQKQRILQYLQLLFSNLRVLFHLNFLSECFIKISNFLKMFHLNFIVFYLNIFYHLINLVSKS